jgi:membrane peptidoglycan carboxypeptidase
MSKSGLKNSFDYTNLPTQNQLLNHQKNRANNSVNTSISSQIKKQGSNPINYKQNQRLEKLLENGISLEHIQGISRETLLALDHSANKPVFGLPNQPSQQEVQQRLGILPVDGYVVEDGRIKIIKKGLKVGGSPLSPNLTTYSSFNKPTTDGLKNTSSQKKLAIGRKNTDQKNTNLKGLRRKFGFSIDKIGQQLGFSLVIATLVIFVTFSLGAASIVDLWNGIPSVNALLRQPAENSILYAKDGVTKIFTYYDEEKREIISINEIPKVMQLAIIALEDENFYKNEQGIPWKNLGGAIRDCFLTGGDNCRGASGISQQVIKNITGRNEKTVDRKVQELMAAIKVNQELNPTQILEIYLNLVPFGRNAYGVQEASKAYFGRPINEKLGDEYVLNPAEACFLASFVQMPSYFSKGIGEKNSREFLDLEFRKNICLEKLYNLDLLAENDGQFGKYIKTEEDLELWKKQKVIEVKHKDEVKKYQNQNVVVFVREYIDDPYPHFREFITKELLDKGLVSRDELYTSGLRITTTFDMQMQADIEGIVKNFEPELKSIGANNASAIILDGPTGDILTMVGSLGYDREDIDGKVNIATSLQQPGSSIKPYVYANAWRNGYNPATIVNDVKTTWEGFTPKNFDNGFSGPVTMRYALQNSLNIPAVKALFMGPKQDADNGWKRNDSNTERTLNGFFNFAESTGLKFPCSPSYDGKKCNSSETASKAYRDRCYIASAIGGCEVTPLSHATGINTILQEGNLRPANPFARVLQKNSKGEQVDITEQIKQKGYQPKDGAINPLLAKQVTNVMTDYEIRSAEFGSLRSNFELNNKKWRVAAKSGTSNGPKDFWVVGGTPYYTVVVWAGRTDDDPMFAKASSSANVAPLWKQIMEYLHKDKEVKNFSTEGLSTIGAGYGELLTPDQKAQLALKSD